MENEESEREEGSANGDDAAEEEAANGTENGTENGNGEGSSNNDDPIEILEHEWYHDGQFDAGVRGEAENVSGEELSYVEISAFLLDGDGVQVGETLDNTTDLAAGRVWAFDAVLLDGDPEVVENYEIKWEVSNY